MVDNYKENYYNEIIKLGKIVNKDFEKLFNINNLNRTEKIYVYLNDNKVTGFIHISSNYEIIDILNIVVEPKYEKQGIGTKLINYIIKKKDTIVSKIMLEVREDNLKAINFYKKNNFTIIAKRQNYYKNKDALIMERKGRSLQKFQENCTVQNLLVLQKFILRFPARF